MPRNKKRKKKKTKRKPQIQHKPYYETIKPGVPSHAKQVYPSCKINPDAHVLLDHVRERYLAAIRDFRQNHRFIPVIPARLDAMIMDDPWEDPPGSAYDDIMRFITQSYCIYERITTITPCSNCKYYHNNPFLQCTVNPKLEDVENCKYWEKKDD